MTWKILNTKHLIDSPWLQIEEQRVRTDDGDVLPDYYVGQKSDFVMVYATTEDGQVIVLRGYSHGAGTYTLGLVAGGVDKNESPEETVARELLEETGYAVAFDDIHYIGSYFVSASWLKDRAHLFRAINAKKVREPRLEKGESITTLLKTKEEVLELIRTNQFRDPYSCLAVLWWEGQHGHQENS